MRAVAPGDRVDQQAGQQAAGHRRAGQGEAVAAEHDHHQRAGGRALGEAEHVGAAQRVAYQGLEHRPGERQGRTHQDGGDHPGQP
ncbi:hypothetical protein GCM10027605_03110 [Micromonospora zhanjiangensis]